MKEARYLIRLLNQRHHLPADQAALLANVRTRLGPLEGKAINLRVTPQALEFDLFCAPDRDVKSFLPVLESLAPVVTCKRLDVAPAAAPAETIVTEARQLFNEQRFWEVHEVLEGLWKERSGEEKQLLQGLILIAAALVHAQKNEIPVVWPMLRDALRRLEGQPDYYYGLDLKKLRDHYARALAQQTLDQAAL